MARRKQLPKEPNPYNPQNRAHVFAKPKYVKHFARIDNSLLLPLVPPGPYWESRPRIPDLPENPLPRPSAFQQQCITQYRGSLEATALANASAVQPTAAKHQSAQFRLSKPHPLSECLTYHYHKMEDGQTMVVKDPTPKFSAPTQSADHKSKSKTNGVVMSQSGPDDGSQFDTTGLDRSDKKIGFIAQRILPDMPHLVSVPTKNPYLTQFPYENRNIPFEEWEFKQLQYMTLVSSGNRGVAWVKGDWQDEYNAASPYSGPRSGTATPRSERDPNKPRTKMSFADYRAGKRPTSSSQPARPNLSQSVQNGQSSSAIPAVSPTQQMIDQIIEDHEPKPHLLSRLIERQPSHASRPPPQPFKKNPPSPPAMDPWGPPLVDPMRKPERQAERGRVVWPPSVPERKQQLEPQQQQPKRQLDATEPSHSAKRAKFGLPHPSKSQDPAQQNAVNSSSTTSKQVHSSSNTAQNSAPAVATTSDAQHNNDQRRSAQPPATLSSLKPSKASGDSKQKEQFTNGSHTSPDATASNSVDALPPLLSPLPPSLSSPDDHTRPVNDSGEKELNVNHIAPPISMKSKVSAAGPSQHRHKSNKSPPPDPSQELPPLLSPLPQWFMEQVARDVEDLARMREEELAHIREMASTSGANTVGARRERSRQPDTPGVARKATKAQSAHFTGTKDLPGDSSNSVSVKARKRSDDTSGKSGFGRTDRERLVVKLKYGKRQAKTIGRILQMKARPTGESKASHAATSTTLGSDDRKHPRVSDDHEEPSAKRVKAPANLDLQRARTPSTPTFQSPAPSASSTSQKATFSTPKKGDAMKSVAMRKVDSSDGRVQTPQGAPTSTPASAEKPRINGNEPKSAEMEALRAANAKYAALGTTLKRQADHILKSKETNPGPVSEEDKRLGAVIAIESVTAYMVGFNAFDALRQMERKPHTGDNWTQFFAFLSFAVDRAKPHGELYTLALLLSAVSREALDRIYAERLASEPAGATPEYLKDVARNSRNRQHAWHEYREQTRQFPVEFVMSVPDAKTLAVSVLEGFCKKMDISREIKVGI